MDLHLQIEHEDNTRYDYFVELPKTVYIMIEESMDTELLKLRWGTYLDEDYDYRLQSIVEYSFRPLTMLSNVLTVNTLEVNGKDLLVAPAKVEFEIHESIKYNSAKAKKK